MEVNHKTLTKEVMRLSLITWWAVFVTWLLEMQSKSGCGWEALHPSPIPGCKFAVIGLNFLVVRGACKILVGGTKLK